MTPFHPPATQFDHGDDANDGTLKRRVLARAVPAVPTLAVIVLFICILAIADWLSGDLAWAELEGHGKMRAGTILACIALSLAILGEARGRFVAARGAAAVALMVALIGSALRLFPGLVSWPTTSGAAPATLTHYWIPHPWTLATLFLLSGSMLFARGERRGRARLVASLPCLALLPATFSLTEPLAEMGQSPMTGEQLLMATPSSLAILTLSIAIVLMRWRPPEPAALTRPGIADTLYVMLVPCVMLPMASLAWQIWHLEDGSTGVRAVEIVLTALLVLICCVLISWIWRRVEQENGMYRAISEGVDGAPIAITDLDGRIIHWAAGCELLYGWTAAEARGRTKHELTAAATPAPVRAALTDPDALKVELTEQHRDGTPLQVLEARRIVRSAAGSAPMAVLYMTDITALRRTSAILLAKQKRLDFVLAAADAHHMGLFEWSQVKDMWRMNGHAERLLGFAPGQKVAGQAAWRRHLRERFDTGAFGDPFPPADRAPFAFRLSARDAEAPLILEGSAFFQESGPNGLTMVGMLMDATERELQTEQLKAREYELSSILETVPEAMITIDGAGCVRSFSTAAEQLFGYEVVEMIGRDIHTLLPDYTCAAATTHAGSRPTTGVDRDGNEVPVELSLGETMIGNEQIHVAFVRSLQGQIAAQTRMNELRDQLLHAARVSTMGEIGAGLAHELNQPLAATANFLAAANIHLDAGRSLEKAQQMVNMANVEVLRAGEIIRRMRAFVAKEKPDAQPVAMDDLIVATIQLVRSGTRHARTRLNYNAGPPSPVVVADQIQMQQVLINIINNAFETLASAGTRNPQITIRSSRETARCVVVEVEDNGPGFPQAIIDHPFEAFVSMREGGMGLGLSICRRIIEGHGGTLTLGNGPTGGAMVRFILPAFDEAMD